MSAPNNYGSNLTKSVIVLQIDPTGTPYGPTNPMPINLIVDPSDGIATAANQTTEITALGTINTSVGATNTALGTTNTEIGATNETAAASDSATSGLNGLIKRLLTRLSTIISAVGTAATNAFTTQGTPYTGTSTVTRAANQTPYTAGDVVGGALTIATAGPSGGDVIMDALRLMLNITALPAGMTSFTLHVYNATPPSAIVDNGVWTLGSGDRAAYLGNIQNIVPALLGTGTATPFAQLQGFIDQYKLVGGTSLFAYLVTNGGFTPAANSETYTLTTKGFAP